VTLDDFKTSLRALVEAMGHAQFEVHETVAEGDVVVVRWTVHGVHQGVLWGRPPTGEPFAIEGVNIFRVRDGRIVERRSFLDPVGIVRLGHEGSRPRDSTIAAKCSALIVGTAATSELLDDPDAA
jgi:predicted ester cyclase